MTQQAPDLVIEPQTRRYALVSPGAGGLLRPNKRRASPGGSDHWTPEALQRRYETRAATMAKRREEGFGFRPSRYVGLTNHAGRRDKYREAERVGVARKLMPHEIEEWYSRLAAIQQGKEKLVGPLDEKLRR